MIHQAAFKVRFDEVDYARVVYFPKFFEYCHWTFEDFFEKEAGIAYAQLLSTQQVGFPTVRTESNYRSPLRFGDHFTVELQTRKLGKASLVLSYRIVRAGGVVCAEIELTHVATDLTRFVSCDLPPNIRAAFSRFSAREARLPFHRSSHQSPFSLLLTRIR